jgi:hypothetical protein
MAVRSFIGKFDKKITGIYCHNASYPEHHLAILNKYYNNLKKLNNLLALGNLSELEISTACPVGHSYESRNLNCCVAYGRDRGDKNTKAKTFTYSSFVKKCLDKYDYVYLFDIKNEVWFTIYGERLNELQTADEYTFRDSLPTRMR